MSLLKLLRSDFKGSHQVSFVCLFLRVYISFDIVVEIWYESKSVGLICMSFSFMCMSFDIDVV